MECPQCRLSSPEGSLRCNCGFSFETKSVDSPLDRRTVTFSSSIGAAAALLASLGWALLIVTAAWAYARQYRWLAQGLQVSDGTTAQFTGDPKNIWFFAMSAGLFQQVDRWLTPIINRQASDETTRMILILIFALSLWSAQTVVWLKIWRWAVAGVSPSSGAALHFDGGAAACFGWVCLGNLLAALLLPTRGLILLGLPPLFLWYARWWISHVHSERRRLRFVASLTDMWWRTLAAMVLSILLITIPIAAVWFTKWVVDNIWIESEKRHNIAPTLTAS
jgi:hypothetical protein